MTRGPGRSGQLRGTLDVLALKALSLEPLQGVGVFQRIHQITNNAIGVSHGSLFPALHRLEARGWLDAEWKASDHNRQAKFYRLTRAGKKQLEREEREWRHRQRGDGGAGIVLPRGGVDMFEELCSWMRNLLRRTQVDDSLDREVRSCVEIITANKIRDGLDAAEARRQALIEIGGVELVKDQSATLAPAPGSKPSFEICGMPRA